MFFKRIQILLIGGRQIDHIKMQHEGVHGNGPGLHRRQEIFKGLNGTLKKITELKNSPVGIHQGPHGLKKSRVLQRLGKRGQRTVRRHLLNLRIDRHLRLHRRDPPAISTGKIEALNLNMLEDFGDVPIVAGQQRIINSSVLVRQISIPEIVADMVV